MNNKGEYMDKREIILERAKHVKKNMDRAERNGADCHEMDNITQCANGLIDLIENDCKDEALQKVLESIEERTKTFFIKRYGHIMK